MGGYIYILIQKDMYGLRNAVILAYKNLKRNLEPFGYVPLSVCGATSPERHDSVYVWMISVLSILIVTT